MCASRQKSESSKRRRAGDEARKHPRRRCWRVDAWWMRAAAAAGCCCCVLLLLRATAAACCCWAGGLGHGGRPALLSDAPQQQHRPVPCRSGPSCPNRSVVGRVACVTYMLPCTPQYFRGLCDFMTQLKRHDWCATVCPFKNNFLL